MLGQDELHKCYANDSQDNAATRSAHNIFLIVLTLDLYPKALDGGHCFHGDPVKDLSMRVIAPQRCQEFDCGRGSRKLDGPVRISQKNRNGLYFISVLALFRSTEDSDSAAAAVLSSVQTQDVHLGRRPNFIYLSRKFHTQRLKRNYVFGGSFSVSFI